jgi:hypothetical protein
VQDREHQPGGAGLLATVHVALRFVVADPVRVDGSHVGLAGGAAAVRTAQLLAALGLARSAAWHVAVAVPPLFGARRASAGEAGARPAKVRAW